MNPSSLAEHVRDTAVKHLTEQGKEITPEAIEEQGIWILALWHAEGLHDLRIKDFAHFFVDGIEPIKSIDEECKNLTDDDTEGDEISAVIVEFINNL